MEKEDERILEMLLRLPKEQISSMTEKELLHIVLHYLLPKSEIPTLAESICNNFSSIYEFFTAPKSRFVELGISDKEKLFEGIAFMREFCIRSGYLIHKSIYNEETYIDFVRMAQLRIGYLEKETIIALVFSPKKEFLGMEIVALGSENLAIFDAKTLLEVLDRCSAKYCLLAHNHPSGEALPSSADKEGTQKILHVFEIKDVILLDHIVVTARSIFSIMQDKFVLGEEKYT